MKAPVLIDPTELKIALEDLEGLAALLLDVSRYDNPSATGITSAARFLEQIHNRIEDAVGLGAGG